MKKVMLAGVFALVLTAGGASAADVNMPLKAPVAPAAFDWGGFYVGGNVGWMRGTTTSTDTNLYTGYTFPSDTTHTNGFSGGVHGGYNWVVFPNWLLGLEADGTATTLASKEAGCETSPTGGSCSTVSRWDPGFISFRGRVGFIWSNLLIYGTGGYAAFDHRTTVDFNCISGLPNTCPGASSGTLAPISGIGSTAQAWSNGWVYGGGLEWGFGDRWSARLEYNHYQFSYTGGFEYGNCGSACLSTPPPNANQLILYSRLQSVYQATSGFDTVMVGINYLFWPGL